MLIKHAATAVTALLLAPLQRALPSSGPQPPVDPPSITPEWATAILRQQGLLTAEQRVASVGVTEFEAGKTGRCARVALTYDPKASDAPASVVVKMSRTDFKGRFLNLVLSLSREAHFFAELGPECPMPIPKCLYSSVSWFSNAFIIVMQDCHPARVLSDIDEAKRAFGR